MSEINERVGAGNYYQNVEQIHDTE